MATDASKTDQPARIFRLRLIALPEVSDPERSLRGLLKRFLRSHGWRCLEAAPERPAPPTPPEAGVAAGVPEAST